MIWPGTNTVLRLPAENHFEPPRFGFYKIGACYIRLVLGITKRCDWLYFPPTNQSVSVFHQHMPRVTQVRFFPSALLRQSRIPIRRRFIRRVGPLLSVNLQREVATVALGRLAVSILALETRSSRPGPQQRLIHGEVLVTRQTLLPFPPNQ